MGARELGDPWRSGEPVFSILLKIRAGERFQAGRVFCANLRVYVGLGRRHSFFSQRATE